MQLSIFKKNSNVLFFLTGLLVFSSFYKFVLSNFLGINLSLPEIVLFPFVILLRKKFQIKIDGISLFFAIIVWLVLYYLGTMDQSNGSLFTHSRGFLYIFLFFIFFKNPKTKFDTDYFLYLSFGSLCGWLFISLYNLFLSRYSFEDLSGFTYGNLLAIPLFLSSSYFRNKRIWFYIGVCIIIAIIFTAGLRRVIVVFLVSLFLIFFFPTQKTNNRKLIIPSILLSLLAIIVYQNINIIGNYIYDYSPNTYYRIFEKTADSLDDNLIVEDIKRIGFFEYYLQHFDEELLPNGFLKTSSEQEFGRFNDFPVLELSHTFGFLGLVLILIYFFRCLIVSTKKAYSSLNVLVFLIPGFIIFLLAFLDGSFLTNPIVTPLTGVCLGKLALFTKNNSYNE